ncbi:tRNA pseudouridine(55) synthase TruB [Dehalobacterium formicoaceticum]|uniref:tRNA pseudouridine(55) synthase TruB n=1 Tax=Dehalobacterium formicoaceticum TaxID=51515 RepID=UPI000B7FE613|nr:tRNA pseudouridine(55) synthase TruB [Dehalobacterium formicoaceticum]
MDGFINVLKPPGMTSHDVVGFVRKKIQQKKAGHTGTLDPGVAGVLPVCVGKATRLSEYITDQTKGYRGEITFGRATDSQDAYGSVLWEKECTHLQYEDFLTVLPSFIGQIQQLPPMTSAVRVEGQRLYDLARKGIEVERKQKSVIIHSIDIIHKDWSLPHPKVIFDVSCSKGTYIRTLCHDIGMKLGVGACLSFLIRTKTAGFQIQNAYTLEEISSLAAARDESFLLPMEAGISFISALAVGREQEKELLHGKSILLPKDHYQMDRIYQAQGPDHKLIALGRIIMDGADAFIFKPLKVLG